MLVERGVPIDDLVLIRRVKPCKAVLRIGNRVRLNSGSAALPIIAINGDDITVETKDWRGQAEAVTMPRGCWQKATIWNWLTWKLGC